MSPRRRAAAALACFLLGAVLLVGLDRLAARLAGAGLLVIAIAFGASAILTHDALAGSDEDAGGGSTAGD